MEKLFWLDLEMTGLDVNKEVVIEAAAIITDYKWTHLESYHAIVKQPQKYLDNMDEWNTKHHSDSGLTALVPKGKDPHLVEIELIELLGRHFKERPAVLAGNSIAQDRLFIKKYFTKLNEKLHYRMLDVSSWKVVFNHSYDIKYKKKNTHRAVDDITESIAELKFYLDYIHPKKSI